MNSILPTLLQTAFVLLAAPLLTGWVNQWARCGFAARRGTG